MACTLQQRQFARSILCALIIHVSNGFSFLPHLVRNTNRLAASLSYAAISGDAALQTTGRGADHLTYILTPGDIVIYQAGLWNVDGYPVGDGPKPRVVAVRCEVVQINWTHDMEHGRVLCTPLLKKTPGGQRQGGQCGVQDWGEVHADEDRVGQVEVGPEQVVARIATSEWEDGVAVLAGAVAEELDVYVGGDMKRVLVEWVGMC